MNGMYGYGNGYGYAPPYTPQMCTGAWQRRFLFDKDAKSPNAKMAGYYFGIVDVE